MSARAVIVVSGFGRCGSSLVMQMLAAGGVRCLGNAPAYESFDRVEPGQAIKILDPQHDDPIPYAVPPGARVIWVDRDVEEQAASHAKFTEALMGMKYSREARRRLVAALRSDRPRAMRAIGARPLLVLTFEALLARPEEQAERIAAFIGGGFESAAAAGQIRPRHPRCAPGLDMEIALMQEAQ